MNILDAMKPEIYLPRFGKAPSRTVGIARVARVAVPIVAVSLIATACSSSVPAPPDDLAKTEDPALHQVRDGETLYGIASTYCSSASQATQAILELNRGSEQVDGGSLQTADDIEVGWLLQITCGQETEPEPPPTQTSTTPTTEETPTTKATTTTEASTTSTTRATTTTTTEATTTTSTAPADVDLRTGSGAYFTKLAHAPNCDVYVKLRNYGNDDAENVAVFVDIEADDSWSFRGFKLGGGPTTLKANFDRDQQYGGYIGQIMNDRVNREYQITVRVEVNGVERFRHENRSAIRCP